MATATILMTAVALDERELLFMAAPAEDIAPGFPLVGFMAARALGLRRVDDRRSIRRRVVTADAGYRQQV